MEHLRCGEKSDGEENVSIYNIYELVFSELFLVTYFYEDTIFMLLYFTQKTEKYSKI